MLTENITQWEEAIQDRRAALKAFRRAKAAQLGAKQILPEDEEAADGEIFCANLELK